MGQIKKIYQNICSIGRTWRICAKYFIGHFTHPQRSIRYTEFFAPQDPSYHPYGMVTTRYPKEQPYLSDHNRGKLHNEISDCIVCDKCANVCPTNCISIEKEREDLGQASNGMPKRFKPLRFDIDLSKCCFCGLCTHVCPTECLIMEPTYAYSTDDLKTHNLSFA